MNNAFKRIFGVFFISFFTFGAFAQTTSRLNQFNSFYLHPLSTQFNGSMVSADAGLQFSSNAVINGMAYDLYLQNHLKGSDIKKTVEKLKDENTAGRELNLGAQYIFPAKKAENQFWLVKYNFRRHQSARFTGDFGRFFFVGNSPYAGKEMIFDNLKYLQTRYDALQFGHLRYFTIKGRRANITVNAGLARGYDYRRYDVGRSRMFTESNGEYINLSMELDAKQSYFSPYNFFKTRVSGWGALCGVNFNMAVTDKSGIGVDISDLGFISWDNRSSVYTRRDTTINFTGVFVPSPDSLASSEYTKRLGDSVVSRFKIPYEKGRFSTALPTRINLTYYRQLTDKNFLNIRLQAMLFTNYRPQVSIESINFFGKRWFSTTGIAVGGFGPLDIYQQVGFQYSSRFSAAISLYGIEGMLLPSSASGFGGSINLAYRILKEQPHLNF